MGQYWTRKGDQEDKDERTVCPWTEHVGNGDRRYPDPNQDKEEYPPKRIPSIIIIYI